MKSSSTVKQELEEQGYSVVSLFSRDELAQLKRLYTHHYGEKDLPAFYATMFDEDLTVKLSISNELGKLIQKKAQVFLPEHRYLFANFLIKPAQSNHMVGIHQDWTYVDEDKALSYNVWSALDNTTEENGGLWVLPQSHLFHNPFRGTPFQGSLYNDNENLIREHAIFVPTQAGEAIIYNSRLIHFSYPNKSTSERVAFAGIMIPKELEALHYFEKDGSLYEYAADEKFFCSLNPDKEPAGQIRQKLISWHKSNSADLANFIRSFAADGKAGREDDKSR